MDWTLPLKSPSVIHLQKNVWIISKLSQKNIWQSFIEKSKSFKSYSYISWQSLSTVDWTLPYKSPSVKKNRIISILCTYNYPRKINDVFIEKSKSFKSNPYISWQSLISRHWTLTFASPSVITDTWTTTLLDFEQFDIILISKMKKKVNRKYFIRWEKSLTYLRATDRFEFWRKNEVSANQRRFNVNFCAGF